MREVSAVGIRPQPRSGHSRKVLEVFFATHDPSIPLGRRQGPTCGPWGVVTLRASACHSVHDPLCAENHRKGAEVPV